MRRCSGSGALVPLSAIPSRTNSPLAPFPPVEITSDSGAAGGGAARGAASRGAEPGGAEPWGAELECAEPRGAEPRGAASGGAEPRGAESGGAEPASAEPEGAEPGGAEPGGIESGGTVHGGAASAGGPPVALLELEALELEALEPEALELEALELEALELEAQELEALELEALDLEALELEVLELEALELEALELEVLELEALELGLLELEALELELLALEALELEVLSLPSSTALPPDSPLPAPPRYTELSASLTERREPASRPASPLCAVRTGRRVPRERPPPVPGTHTMALRPSSIPKRVPLPSPPASSLPDVPDPESDLVRAAHPTITRLLATVVTDPSQEDFECLAAAVPHLVAMLLAPEGDPDAPDIPNPRSYAEAITGPYSSQWQTAMDAEMASWKSTGTYVDEVPPPGANITFSPTPKMTTLWVLLHVAAVREYELHSLDFSTTFLQGSLHEEIWLRRPPGFTGSFPAGTQWSLRRPVYGLRQAPREWHDTLRATLAALGFAPSTADPSLFLRTDTSLPPFYILVYVDDLVFATADTEALALVKSEL
ncbi:unnamed protein product [Closterium sp. Yama58-4]|nr:unnamed protein product [Closterium sp. Yama58-4]